MRKEDIVRVLEEVIQCREYIESDYGDYYSCIFCGKDTRIAAKDELNHKEDCIIPLASKLLEELNEAPKGKESGEVKL